ncbi:partial Cyclic di-GMP phosphodiesterase response regulator RpfG, partial [Anaerolineales bacterium]
GLHSLRKPVIVSDTQSDDRFTHFEETSYIRGWMAIPLFVTDEIIGFLNLDSRTPNFFNEEHASIAQTFANQAAIAMENARLFQEEKRRSKIIEAMANIANEIALTQELTPALEKIAQHTLTLLNALSVAVYLLQEDKQTIKIIAAQGKYREELLSHTIKIEEGITGNIIAIGKPEIVNDISKDTRRVTVPGTPIEEASFETMMSAPLILHGTSIGAINVWRLKTNGLFDNSELNFLVSIAHQASISIESMRLFEETKRRAQEAAAIAEVGRDISATLQLDNVLERIAMYAKVLLNTETSAVYLSEPGILRAIATIGMEADEIKNDPVQIGKGILGQIALHQAGEIVNNSIDDPRATAIKGTEIGMYEHIMGAPILSKDYLTGLLVVWRTGIEKEFKEADLIFLRSLAQQAAVAIENARLFELEYHRRKQAEILSQATSALANTLDINSLYENILDWLQKIAPYDSASIMLHNGDVERLVAKRNLPERFQIGQVFPMTPKWQQVAESRKPYILEDAQQSEYFEKWEGSAYIHGWMCLAMYTQEKLIGFINLDSETLGIFTEEHGILAQTFANQAAAAIENARLFQLEQKRRKDAEIIRQAATILTSLLDLPSLHEAILEWLYRITPYDSATIFELEGNRVHIAAARGLSHLENLLSQTFSADNILCRIMNETFEPLIIEDCEVDSRFERWGDIEGVRGWMGVPMIARGQVIGYITLDSHIPNAYTQSDAIAAQTFAHQAATSLENSRLFTETKQRLEELEVVSRISFSLRAAHDTQEMLPILLDEIKTSMDTDSAAIWLYDIGNNELVSQATAGHFDVLRNQNFKPGDGIVGTVYSNGVIHVSPSPYNDLLAVPEDNRFFGDNRSGIVVPIRTTTEIIGALAIALTAPHKIKPHQTRLLTTIAEIAGNAIYRSNLYQRSEEQIQRLTTLRELDTAIASSLDLRITLSILTEHLIKKMKASAVTVLVFNPHSQTFDYYAAAGFKNRENLRAPLNLVDGMAGQILLSRRALYIKDVDEETSLISFKQLKSEQFRSYYAIPLFSKGVTRGILEIYFRQPFSPSTEWIEFVHTLAEQAVIAIDNAQLFENLQHTNQELSLAYDTTLEGWGKALELRDKETQGHTQRVTGLTLELARQMGIPEPELLQIRRGCLLHDIGKMGVPDNILHKKGTLTEEELSEMRKHPQYAYDMLYPIEYLRPALDIVYCHHEWWDGSGYPQSLKGEEIPLSARIFAVIDVWDALSSDRPYRHAWDREKIIEYIRGLSGKQFDPQVVDAFFVMLEDDEK